LYWLGKALGETGCAPHAYVVMTHHVHLLLTPRKAASVRKLITSLGRRYVQYINRSYRRSGTLWDSRYKSSAVQADTYLLACQRYIELNPVRAAMVDDPVHYRWSNDRSNALGQADPRITPHVLYWSLGRTDKERQQVCGRCLGPNSTGKPSTISGLRSIRTSRSAMSVFIPRSKG